MDNYTLDLCFSNFSMPNKNPLRSLSKFSIMEPIKTNSGLRWSWESEFFIMILEQVFQGIHFEKHDYRYNGCGVNHTIHVVNLPLQAY